MILLNIWRNVFVESCPYALVYKVVPMHAATYLYMDNFIVKIGLRYLFHPIVERYI